MLTVPSLMEELAQAKKRGVKVKVLLEKHPYNATAINQAAVRYFQNNDIDFHETDDKYFSFMHAKYVIIDDKWMISTANWTKSSFSTNREFFMLGQDQKILNSLKEIFESDF
jgi:phosphatidylserine/phosphatidylglycerophosphate/cardiolipin synthase-like enzyme